MSFNPFDNFNLFSGKKGKSSTPPAPTFQADPLVGQADSTMFNFGNDILKGILPSSYQDLLESNSPQFQSVLNNSNRDVTAAGLNTAALQGNARSGAANAGITSAVANNSSNLRYADYMNTLTNQKSLLGIGLDSVGNAGNMALGNQGQINSFNSNIYGTQSQYDLGMQSIQQKAQASQAGMIGSGISGLISGIPYLKNLFGGSGGNGGGSGITGTLGSDAAYSAGTDSAAAGDLSSILGPLMATMAF